MAYLKIVFCEVMRWVVCRGSMYIGVPFVDRLVVRSGFSLCTVLFGGACNLPALIRFCKIYVTDVKAEEY